VKCREELTELAEGEEAEGVVEIDGVEYRVIRPFGLVEEGEVSDIDSCEYLNDEAGDTETYCAGTCHAKTDCSDPATPCTAIQQIAAAFLDPGNLGSQEVLATPVEDMLSRLYQDGWYFVIENVYETEPVPGTGPSAHEVRDYYVYTNSQFTYMSRRASNYDGDKAIKCCHSRDYGALDNSD